MKAPSLPRLLSRRWPILLLIAAGPRLAPATPLPDQTLGTQWYTISILGNRSGWSEQSLRATPDGLESAERTVLRVRLDGRTLTSSRSEVRQYDAEWRLVSLEHQADQMGRAVQIVARRQGDKLHVTRTSPDGQTTQELSLPDDFGGDLLILRALLEGQVKPGWQQSFSTFDCDLGKVDRITMRAVERLNGDQPGWLLEGQSQSLGVQMKTWVSDYGVILRQEVPGMMGMSLQRVSQQEALAELEPFLLSSEVAVGRDLGAAAKLRQVRLQVTSSGSPAETLFPETARQKVALANGVVTLTVSSGSPPQVTVSLPVTAPELQPFLQPSDLAPSGDARLQAQAREIIGKERNAWQAARLLMQWVYRHVTKVSSEPRPLSALEVLQGLRGDCTEHSVLLAALAQSVGIPTRMVAGLAYDSRAYHYHAWNELYVGQWVEMDATWGEEVLDAGHVQIASAALDGAAIARMSLAASKTMGTLSLKVLDFQSAP